MKIIKPRSIVVPMQQHEITELLGENHFQSTMALFEWIAYRSIRQLDNRKIDFVCRYENALIEVQLKSSNLNDKGVWNWAIFQNRKNSKGLDRKFYDQSHTFLCLVGIKVENKESDEIKYRESYKETRGRQDFPAIALIPGEEVVKRFGNRKTGWLKLSYIDFLNEEDPWSEYFKREKMYELLKDDAKKQENENIMTHTLTLTDEQINYLQNEPDANKAICDKLDDLLAAKHSRESCKVNSSKTSDFGKGSRKSA